ncbi:MAG TPA: hypothetical protein DCL38_07520 [Lachnospiraceae bacterium]|nr:hypothetical protein [Lachnospiraceae bacterium]
MKGKIYRTILVLMLSGAVLTACGKDKAAPGGSENASENAAESESGGKAAQDAAEPDIQTIAQQLKDQITYQDELSEVDLDTASMFMSLQDVAIEEAVFYESSGATAEEIAVLKCASPEDAGKAEAALKTRVEEQKEAFEDYVPEELNKLSEAVIVVKGRVAVLSISNDPGKAKEILENI